MKNNLEQFKRYIKKEIDKYDVDSKIKEMLEYVLISDGKYFRPQLLFAYLMDHNLDVTKYFDVALGIEMIHTYSLVHDDLPAIDNDDYRRGKLTCHMIYGEDNAILVGDMLLTNSFQFVLNNNFLSDFQKVSMINEMISSAGTEGMIYGQYLDVNNLADNVQDLLKLHNLKTGKMIALPIKLGEIITNESDPLLRNVSEKLGVLYQIQDDYLDKYGSEIGKSLNADKSNNKRTFTYYYSKDQLEKILNDQTEEIISGFLNLKKYQRLKDVFINVLERDR